MELLTRIKALSDETRLKIYSMLLIRELSVNEIVGILNISQPRVSRHLKILAEAGLVSSRRDGLWVFYKATNGKNGKDFKEIILNDEEMLQELQRFQVRIAELELQKTKFYDSLAPQWDKLKKSIFGNINIAEEIVARAISCNIAADLGCGTGELLPALSQKAAHVIGIDKSPKMLELARKRTQRIENAHIDLRLGEIEHLPVRDGEIDLAVLNMVLHHLSEPQKGLTETARALKEGGQCIVVELDQHAHEEFRNSFGHRWLGFSRNLMEQWLQTAGFLVTDVAQLDSDTGLSIIIYVSKKS